MPLRIKFKINFTQTKNWRQTTSTDWGCLVFVVQSNLSSNKLIYVGCWYRPNARNHMAILGTLHEISLSITIVHMFSARNTPWLVCYLTWDITTEKYGLKQLKFCKDVVLPTLNAKSQSTKQMTDLMSLSWRQLHFFQRFLRHFTSHAKGFFGSKRCCGWWSWSKVTTSREVKYVGLLQEPKKEVQLPWTQAPILRFLLENDMPKMN